MRGLKKMAVLVAVTAAMAHGQFYVPEVSTAGAVTIDGNLGEWASATWIPLDKVYSGSVTDLSNASWSARWNNAANLIYVAVRGTDTQHWFNAGYTGATGADDVEVYVDASNSNSTTFKVNGWDKAQQYIGGPTSAGNTMWLTLAGEPLPANTVPAFACSVVGDVIQYEFALKPYNEYYMDAPLDSLLVDLQPGRILGLDVVMNTKNALGGFGGLCQNTMPAKHRDASAFLDVMLIDGSMTLGPVHQYRFNGDCQDAVSTAHGALINNTGAAAYATVNGQTSLVLGNNGIQNNRPGSGDYVELPAGLISGMGKPGFTLEFWVTFASRSPVQNFFQFGTDFPEGGPDSGQWMYGTRNRYEDRSAFHWSIGGLGTLFYSSRDGTSNSDKLVFPLRQETQVVYTYDSATRRGAIYLHGKPIVKFTTANGNEWRSPTLLADLNNWLGRGFTDQDQAFEGSYNELSIYNRVLADFEVFARWQTGPAPSGTVGDPAIEAPAHLYTFNDQNAPGADMMGGGSAAMVNTTGGSAWQEATGPNAEQHGYWKLGNNGTQLNGPGENGDYIKLPAELIPNLNAQNLTIETWVSFNQAVESGWWGNAIYSLGKDGNNAVPPVNGADPAYYMFLIITNMDDYDYDHKWRFGWGAGVNASNYIDIMYARFSRPANPREEIQYVCTYDRDGRRSEVYMNGVFVGGYSTPDDCCGYNKWPELPNVWSGNNPDNWLGRGFDDDGEMLPLTFNEFRIYPRVLTDKEIAFRYTQGPVSLTDMPPTCGTPAVDLNKDNKVDAADMLIFEACTNGPGQALVDTFQCHCADVSGDGALDNRDFAAIQRCWNDGTHPVAAGCAD